jgi:hypothetical protein
VAFALVEWIDLKGHNQFGGYRTEPNDLLRGKCGEHGESGTGGRGDGGAPLLGHGVEVE